MLKRRKFFCAVMIFSFFASLFISKVESAEVPKISPVVSYPIKHDISPPLMLIPPVEPMAVERIQEIPLMPIIKKLPYVPFKVPELDHTLQDWHGSSFMPSPIMNFAGMNNRNNVLPPDTNGDVGPDHYVQMINLSFAVWDKTGILLYGPANNNTLWSGFGGPCETYNNGDPTVLYDHKADRWLMSQFAIPGGTTGYHECIAISQTGDPTGAWYRYDFLISNTKTNDYPKFGIWPDAYYMSVNQFDAGSWAGAGAVAFERSKMLLGQSARMIYFDLALVDLNLGGMLPSHMDGSTLPPTGSPNYFVQFDDDAWGYPQDQLEIWRFHVDWTTPANSTFTGPTLLATAAFDSNLCSYSRNCIPQPGTTARVDAISDRLMYRLQYRNFGTHQSMVVNHTVDAGVDHAGIRWYELRNSDAGWTIYQQGTYAPDSDHRWMGSIAMDSMGNIALGYSVSSNNTYPSIRYTGRLVTDPPGILPQAEATLIAGSGAQTQPSGRWGDYSSISVDPSDDCTFWYTQEYFQTTSPVGWQTRIGSFAFPSCLGVTTGTLRGTVTDGLFPTKPIPNAKIDLNPPFTSYTDFNGIYQFLNLPSGAYDITASALRYTPSTVNGVSVPAGGTITRDFALACNVAFNDVPPGYWAENYIKSMYCREITNGCSNNPLNFCPENTVNRAVMSVFIVRALGESPSPVAYNAYFDDIANDWFAPYINRMYELGITTGCGARLFCPYNVVKRTPAAVFIIRALGESPSPVAYNAYFDDIADDWFAPYINRMFELGITTGCGTRLFCPYNVVKRAPAAIFIIRAF